MNVKEYLDKQSKWHLITLGFAIVVLVGVIDHLTGPELFVSIFYLLPIFLVTWFTERWMGVTISIALVIVICNTGLKPFSIFCGPSA